LKDESTLKSTVDTINRLYKLSKSKGSKTEHTCFLCKSSIDDAALQGIEQNFLKKDAATQQKETKIA
jgi:PP-loop superfamily ATP-utilizing enzyme